MPIERGRLKWNGWGWEGHRYDLEGREAGFLGWLGGRLGHDAAGTHTPSVSLDEVELPPGRLDPGLRDALGAIVGPAHVRIDRRERVLHALGRSLHDLLRLRAGQPGAAPDAVVYPETAEQVADLIRLAVERGLALVPYGGGTSVVGGVEARDPGGRPVLTLDTTRLWRRLDLDRTSRLARFEAGVYGPDLEASLDRDGYTLGHFPQSFEFSTLGGWIAARSAGQQSNHHGRIEDLVAACRVVTPRGELVTWRGPASAAGPDLRALVAGSEGTLGVIVEATVRVAARPEARDLRAVLFRSFAEGAEAVRAICQEGLRLSFLRLSDAEETELYLRLGRRPAVERLGLAALGLAGYGGGRAVMLVGDDGEAAEVARAVDRAVALCRRHGGLPLGRGPARGWFRHRFEHPYLRDTLLDRGVATDTLETAAPWGRLGAIERAVRGALVATFARQGRRGLVTAHLSHSYPDGSSLYFILLYPVDRARPVEQWWEIKRAASDALRAEGATISHHHGVGLDHRAWLAGEKGAVGLGALAAVKRELDPRGVLNPGKLLPD